MFVYGQICTLGVDASARGWGEPGWKDRAGPAQPSLTAVYPHPALIQPPNVLHCLVKKRGAGKAALTAPPTVSPLVSPSQLFGKLDLFTRQTHQGTLSSTPVLGFNLLIIYFPGKNTTRN